MTPLLTRIYQSEGGTELIDCLMKYMYDGSILEEKVTDDFTDTRAWRNRHHLGARLCLPHNPDSHNSARDQAQVTALDMA